MASNYHDEVEQFFVSKRGAPMFISPLDWSLVDDWKKMGIPLHIVLRGIKCCFDSPSKTSNGKRVNTLFYCQQEVLSNFKNYVESQIGGHIPQVNQVDKNKLNSSTSSTNSSGFSKKQIIIYITGCSEELEQSRLYAIQQKSQNLAETLIRVVSRLKDIIKRLENNGAIDSENLERDLTLLEELIYQSLRNAVSQEELLNLDAEANQQLYPHKRAMEPAIYQQTLQNYIAKRLRERHFIPRLSLFYMI